MHHFLLLFFFFQPLPYLSTLFFFASFSLTVVVTFICAYMCMYDYLNTTRRFCFCYLCAYGFRAETLLCWTTNQGSPTREKPILSQQSLAVYSSSSREGPLGKVPLPCQRVYGYSHGSNLVYVVISRKDSFKTDFSFFLFFLKKSFRWGLTQLHRLAFLQPRSRSYNSFASVTQVLGILGCTSMFGLKIFRGFKGTLVAYLFQIAWKQ